MYNDHCNDASQTVKKSGEGMKVENDDLVIDGGKSAMMTMRRRPLADRSRLELRQPERHVSDSDMLITEVADAGLTAYSTCTTV